MKLLSLILSVALGVVPAGQAFLRQLQPRDSILVADQVEYGFILDSLAENTPLFLPDFKEASNDTLTLVRDWKLDTLKRGKKIRKPLKVTASIVLAPFEEGKYMLPDIPVILKKDTLLFEGLEMEVKTMPVDTSSFEIHDLKGQMTYPVTFKEVAPWLGGGILLSALIVLAVILIRRSIARRRGEESVHKDPAYIVALRELDKYRGDKYWAPEKQKQFYSGITDALKAYIDDRFGVDAPEMTTAELFAALKSDKDITPEMFNSLKDLFERADFVKFAKFTASNEENAAALPLAISFVTTTYQVEVEQESAVGGEEAAGN